MTGRLRESWTLLWAMVFLFTYGLLVCAWTEFPARPSAPVGNESDRGQPMPSSSSTNGRQGSEVRRRRLGADSNHNLQRRYWLVQLDARLFYARSEALFTTANMLLGGVVFGGLGTGLYSIIIVA